jgi:hypothetical protein
MNRLTCSLLLLCVLPGCSSPEKPSLTSEDPSLKIPAIRESAKSHNEKAVRQLVKDLDSDDPAVRLYAIHGLKEITGTTLDYRYYDDAIERQPALKRWQAWLRDHEGTNPGQSSTQP